MAIFGEWEMRQVLKDGDRKGKGGQGLHEVWRARTRENLMHRHSVPRFPQMYTRTNDTHSS